MLKRTALYEEHRKLGGRLIDFGGWELPVQYSGVIDEHQTCRRSAGLFDVSHMGEIEIRGRSAESYLNFLVTNDVAALSMGQAQYTVMCHENAGIVDDLIVYKRSPDRFLAVVNASNTEKDFQHMKKVEALFKSLHPDADFQVEDQSALYSQIAIQGPQAEKILQFLVSQSLKTVKTYHFIEGLVLETIPALIARTGYTGEDGFEVYIPWNDGPRVWEKLLEYGIPYELKACGLGARDTLRLEMKYPLYGHELTDETHPLEAGLSWVVKMNKGNFYGRDALLQKKEQGVSRKLVGIKLLERGIPRQGYAVYVEGSSEAVGSMTSGTQSPMTKESIGIAYIASSFGSIGQRIAVDIRGVKVLGEIVKTPFYVRSAQALD